MRRKVIQEYVNSFCQRVIDLPSGYDLATFAHFGSGVYRADILTGECDYEAATIPKLELCSIYLSWLDQQLVRRGILRESLLHVNMRLEVEISGLQVRTPFSSQFASANFSFKCESEIKTDEKSYFGRSSGTKEWGFDYYYLRLYGAFPPGWPRLTVGVGGTLPRN